MILQKLLVLCDRIVILSNRPATIKEIIEIKLTCPEGNRAQLGLREAPEFRYYFNKIWKEFDVHV